MMEMMMAWNKLEKTGVYHTGSKWVVQAHYPKITDYVEETFEDGHYHEAVAAKDRHVLAGANVQIHEHHWIETFTASSWHPGKARATDAIHEMHMNTFGA